MKKYILLFIVTLAAFVASAQSGNNIAVRKLFFVAPSPASDTTGLNNAGIVRWDPVTKKYRFWDDLTDTWFTYSRVSGADFWKTTGTTTLLGASTINSGSGEHVFFNGPARFDLNREGNRNVSFLINPETGGITGDGGLNITVQDPSDDEGTEIKVDDLAIEVSSNRTEADFAGMKYGADYSDNFTDRSIPDVGYVWKVAGNTTLIGNANINGNGNSVNFSGHSSFEVGGGSFNTFNAVSTIQLRQADTGLTSEIKADNAELLFSTQDTVRLNIDADGSWDVGVSSGSLGQVLTSNGSSSPPTWEDVSASTSGTYTPSTTNTTNVTSSTPAVFQYLKVGNVVTFSGSIEIQTNGGGAVELRFNPPISSNFSTISQCGGSVSNGLIHGYIDANPTDDLFSVQFSASGAGTTIFIIHGTYQVI